MAVTVADDGDPVGFRASAFAPGANMAVGRVVSHRMLFRSRLDVFF